MKQRRRRGDERRWSETAQDKKANCHLEKQFVNIT